MTIIEHAKRIGICRQTAASWKRSGVNLDDDDQVRERVAKLRNIPPGIAPEFLPKTEPPPGSELVTLEDLENRLLAVSDYGTARTLRAQVGGLRDIVRTRRESGALVSRAEIIEERTRDAYALRQMLLDILGTMPPMLLGQPDEAAIQRAMKPILFEIMNRFHQGHPDYWPDQLPPQFRTLTTTKS